MDKKFLEDKGLLEEAKRFQNIMEYISGGDKLVDEVDSNADGIDDATGMVDPSLGGVAPAANPAMPGAAPLQDPMAAAAQAPTAAPGAAQGGVPGFNPQTPTDTDPAATAEESFDEATPDNAPEGQEGAEGDEEVIDVDELVNSQKQNEEAIEKLTDKFEQFMEKFAEFQGELKANSEFMANLETEIQKRNPTAVEKLTMRSIQSKPFDETPEEYMKNEAPENYSPEDDNNGVGEPRYTITRDDVRNATDYPSIAKTLRDNENTSLKTLLGF